MAELQPEGEEAGEVDYVQCVVSQLLPQDAAVVEDFAQAQSITAEEHVRSIFSAASLEDTAGRSKLILSAIEEQEKFLSEKRARKSVKLVRAAKKALEQARRNNNTGYNKAQALAAAAFVEVSELKTNWTLVQAFNTQQDALHFILTRQASEYRPAGEEFQNFRFQNRKDAMAYILSLDPVPEEYVSCEPLFKRRLRLRPVASPKETKSEIAQQRARATQRILTGGAKEAPREEHPWVVEATGDIFETPPLRTLSDKLGQRFYLAVPPELEKKVLSEGYPPQKRSSVPCFASPAEAVSAYLKVMHRKKEEREQSVKKRKDRLMENDDDLDDRDWGLWEAASELYPVLSEDKQDFKATVLAVVIPAELGHDIITNKGGGLLIRTRGKVLPASCFSRVKRSDAP
ncbi:unnamed protein product [Durusdinium trenchii]|uniref:Uncharacterized protein n=1 Tax=Durusdinium trenchii TaxID=1381693 RepID=A0ABP0Q7Q5_9DINO